MKKGDLKNYFLASVGADKDGKVKNPKITKLITLSGFGDFSEDARGKKDLAKAAKAHGLEFYPTYYDHELKGTPEAIEALTKDLWGMSREEWAENALNEGEAVTITA